MGAADRTAAEQIQHPCSAQGKGPSEIYRGVQGPSQLWAQEPQLGPRLSQSLGATLSHASSSEPSPCPQAAASPRACSCSSATSPGGGQGPAAPWPEEGGQAGPVGWREAPQGTPLVPEPCSPPMRSGRPSAAKTRNCNPLLGFLHTPGIPIAT